MLLDSICFSLTLRILANIFIFTLLTYLLFLKRRSLFVLLVLPLLMNFFIWSLFALSWSWSSSYFHHISCQCSPNGQLQETMMINQLCTVRNRFKVIIKWESPSLSSSPAASSLQSSSPTSSSSPSSSSSSWLTFGLQCLHCLQLLDHWRECIRDDCHLQ